MKRYVREKGTDCYCELTEYDYIETGMNLITKTPPENVVGEFYYNEDGELIVEYYEKEQEQ